MYLILKEVDTEVNIFLSDLESLGLLANTNVIVISDHGMTFAGDKTSQFVTEEVATTSQLEAVVESTAYMMVKVAEGADVASVVSDLGRLDDVDVYANADVPDNLRFRDHDKLLDILVVANSDTMVFGDDTRDEVFVPDAEPGGSDYLGEFYGISNVQ